MSPDLIAVLEWYLQIRRSFDPPDSFLWRLPWETGKWSRESLVKIFQRVLVELGCAPPDGFRWTLHCIRAGAASECNALDIAMSKIRRQGDWSAKSTVPEDVYIDAQCPASDAGRRFFGWLMASAM